MNGQETSDLQNRLRVIEAATNEIMERHQRQEDIGQLAYAVDYLAKIVRKHLETGER